MKIIVFILLLLSQSALSEELKVATFNTGFRHKKTAHRKTRFHELLRGLRKLDADLICLQEIVHKKERNKIIKELDFRYNYHHFSSQKQAYYRWPFCSFDDLFDTKGTLYCRYENCLKMRGDKLGKCLNNKCGDAFKALRQKNPKCSQAQLMQQDVSVVLAFLNLINPFKRIKRFSGTGRDGLLILSKKKLIAKEEVDYSEISTHRRRGAISAEIEFNGKPLKIFCAHLTSNLDGIYPYPGFFDSWRSENLAQVEKMVIRVDTKRPTLVMGGLGCSRRVSLRDIHDNFEGNCAPLFGKGFIEPFYKMNPKCTYCPYNNLVSNKFSGGLILDNILVNGVSVKEMKLIFNNEIKMNHDLEELEFTYISDHFGVQATLKEMP
ncbi:MAG: hypothetical protein DRQ88_04550 [Epsilonproteobacteria bacterium]|nr:MAG: hypothetical protein DRQ89_07485 [Campylobacterota bacterium]RLA67026.1 MAG: hypothetical protein DRQ88_04550 [Campylobacterota bacterium]